MTLLFLDAETTGLLRKDLDLWDLAQPRAVKIAAEHTDRNGNRYSAVDLLLKPESAAMKAGALAKHGIDPRLAQRMGLRDNIALGLLAELGSVIEVVITFSKFDRDVIAALMYRLEASLGKPRGFYANRWLRPGLIFLDVQQPAAQQAVKKPSDFDTGEYAWPSLDEACAVVLGEPPRGNYHDPWDDLCRLKRLTFALRDRGHFALELGR